MELTRSGMKKDPLEFRRPYQGIIRNLINNINICSRRWVETGYDGYGVAMKGYIKEVEELKTFIKKEEIRLGYYENRNNVAIQTEMEFEHENRS